MKAYLDTNVIIRGGKEKENIILKEMALSGGLQLFISPETYSEQQDRSSTHYYGEKAKASRNYAALKTDKAWETTREATNRQQILDEAEKNEWRFWKGCKITHAKSTFAGLIAMAVIWSEMQLSALDIKGEIPLLTELTRGHKITTMDAMHLMHAHSARIDYFITGDIPLIKKGRKVKWLFPKLFTPKEFIEYVNHADDNIEE